MAELPLAIIPLASLFQTCLQLYDNIITTKDLKGDLNYFSICVKFERAKLDALQRTFEERLPYRAPEPLIKDALNCTKQHLIEIDILLTRHARSSTSRTQEDGGGGGGGGEEEEEVAATRFARSRLLSKTKRPFTTVAWLGHDKERLKELINALQTMNGNVRSLITPSEQNVMDFRLVSGRIATENAEELEGIRLDYESQYPEVTTAAVLKLMTLQSQGTSSATMTNYSVKRFRRSVHDIEWMKLSLGKAARAFTGEVSLGRVVHLEKAFGRFKALAPEAPRGPVLVEWRDGFNSHSSPAEYEERLDRLVTTLQSMYQSSAKQPPSDSAAPRSVDFAIMKCIGWTTPQDNYDRLGLIFECPKDGSTRPITLRERIGRDRGRAKHAPALGVRFDLAYSLAQAVSSLVTIGWVHKGLRSDNICFFDDGNPTTMRRFFLTGFTYARPGDVLKDLSRLPNHNQAYQLYRPPRFALQKAALTKDGCLENAVDAEGSNSESIPRITSAFDIYALGIILVELGLWWTIDALKGPKTHDEFYGDRGNLVDLVASLSYRMGDIYAGVVRQCLNLEPWAVAADGDEDEDEYDFMAKVLQALGRCKA